jgi:3-oxoisoapionate decarboxylase
VNEPAAPPRRRVGLDNYGLFPLDLSPMQTLEWAVAHGADGVAFSGLTAEWRQATDDAALGDLRAFAEAQGLYLEWGGASHIPRDMATWARRDFTETNRRAAREAASLGARVVRSCSGGLMRWHDDSPATEVLLRDTADALRSQAAMFRDHDVVLAIETHFEFTSFELCRLLEMCEVGPGGWLGICLDTMNLLTMLEHPEWASERLLPWVVSTHIKDGGVLMGRDGLTTFPVPIGEGIIDLGAIMRRLDTLPWPVSLSVEDHAGSVVLPIQDPTFLGRFPDLHGPELSRLVDLSERTAGMPGCRPVERSAWPSICEARMARDLSELRALAQRTPDGREDA